MRLNNINDVNEGNYKGIEKVYQVCTGKGTFYFDTLKELKEHFEIKEIQEGTYRLWDYNTPVIKRVLGPMWGAFTDTSYMADIFPKRWHNQNKLVLRYETQEVYDSLSR